MTAVLQNTYQPQQLSCLLVFLPMLYIAWSDEILTPSEIKIIKAQLNKQVWLCEEDIKLIEGLLDPQNPPSVEEMRQWSKFIRHNASQIAEEDKMSLADLGFNLARINASNKEEFDKQVSKQALLQIEESLGIISREAVKEVLGGDTRPDAPPSTPQKASFDLEGLQILLNEKRPKLRQKLRTFLSDPVFKLKSMPVKEEYREQVLQWCKLLADQSWGGIAYPEAGGGQNDMEAYFTIFEMLAFHDLSLVIKFGVQFGLFGGAIAGLGTEKHHAKYLKDTGSLELPGCFAMTEAGHGSNVRDIETTATYQVETETFVIHTPNENAHKTYIGNAAAHAQMAVVFAQLITNEENHGVHAFVVPIRDKEGNTLTGVRIGDNGQKLGLNGVDNGKLWFDQVSIPREDLLNRFGEVEADGKYNSSIPSINRRFFTMLGTLVGGRVGVPIAGLSAAKTALTIAIKYANQRRQFGPPNEAEMLIMDYRTHQRRLIPLLANAYALDFAHKYMVERYLKSSEEDVREIEALAAGLKAISTWNTTHTIQECREACGGNGYMAENRFADLKADTEIFTTFEGDNTVLMQLVAKGRLSEFQKEMGRMDFMGIFKFLSHQASVRITEMNPIYKRNTSEEHLLDNEVLLHAFLFREEHLLTTVARRLQKRIKGGMDSFQAFLETQTHLVSMADAYIHRLILEQFIKKIETVENESVKTILGKLQKLYALHQIEKHKGYFLEHDYMEGAKTKAVTKLIDKLCLDIRKDVEALVDAFQIPDQCLAAPIAFQQS